MMFGQYFNIHKIFKRLAKALIRLHECAGWSEPLLAKVGRLKPPPVLTSGFNRLKPPRSICQKVVNTGQYESEWSIENSKERFCGGLRYL